jgi:hypothetical protein
MKKLLKSIYNILESIGQARAGVALAKAGKIKEAKAIYDK